MILTHVMVYILNKLLRILSYNCYIRAYLENNVV